MSLFAKKTWKDRITEYPTRRNLTKSDGSTELVTIARAEGTVSREGDAFSAETMNDLETRVETAFESLTAAGAITEVQVVTALPADAASHPSTLYLVKG